jgi:hypothetical protein
MANFKGVVEIISGYYQKPIVPWDDNEPVSIAHGMPGLRRAGDPSGDGDCAAHGDLQENGLRASRERGCSFACADQNS